MLKQHVVVLAIYIAGSLVIELPLTPSQKRFGTNIFVCTSHDVTNPLLKTRPSGIKAHSHGGNAQMMCFFSFIYFTFSSVNVPYCGL